MSLADRDTWKNNIFDRIDRLERELATLKEAVAVGIGANPGNLAHFAPSDGRLDVPQDAIFLDPDSGPILEDRTTGTQYRLYVDSGTLSIESV